MKTHNIAKSPKPILPVQKRLRTLWWLWLFYRLLAYPFLVSIGAAASVVSGILWQVLVLLPAFLITPVMIKARSAYLLIVANIVTLIYLATVAVFLLIRIYENAPWVVWAGFGVETLLLLGVNVYLFVLLKRLPPMNKTTGGA